MVLCVAAEIFLASFLLEKIAKETGLKAQPIIAFAQTSSEFPPPATLVIEAPATQTPLWSEVLGQRLEVDTIWHLKAEEHYVAVTLQDGRALLLRGRLADAIDQLPSAAGMQVHRSHWVANAALAGLQRNRGGWRLQLHNTQEVPVARNRQSDVRNWAEALLGS
ncbi:LytTR family DNA-binding domain-containing protein [Pseudorhodobacter sp. W20_MBD10_FR17]|uniref:LytTR family DNA-binding domain-containing protein n=1 Tax=Pseudorhodobacter sp. W20_MBD10_FR17 TaxID=3240266 RepID=UPI003F979E5E